MMPQSELGKLLVVLGLVLVGLGLSYGLAWARVGSDAFPGTSAIRAEISVSTFRWSRAWF